MPHAVLVHDNFMGPTGMGVVVGRHANWLLDAGWSLTLVGENVPDDLMEHCDVVRVPAPRQLPSLAEHVGWCLRAHRALRRVRRADVVHAHSPLLASDADLVTSHFIAHPSHMRGAHETSGGIGGFLRRIQATTSRMVDHRAYAGISERSHISFVSQFLRDEFFRWYGQPRGGWVFAPPAPAWRPVTEEEREIARAHFQVPAGNLCVGFAGGADPRKGVGHLEQLSHEPNLTLLLAGLGSERVTVGRHRGLGFVDIDLFHAACDVVVAPAVFDSAPVAVLQAVARDLPVITTRYSGWATAIDRTGAGLLWEGVKPLGGVVREAVRMTTTAARLSFLEEFREDRQRGVLLRAYGELVAAR